MSTSTELSDMDQELNVLFDQCATQGRDEANINDLASICAEKYTPGQTELQAIILHKFQTSEDHQWISRSTFISKVKEWISELSSIEDSDRTSQVNLNSSPDLSDCCFEQAIYTSTPLHSRPKLNQGFHKEEFYDQLNRMDYTELNDGDKSIHSLRLQLSREREVLKDTTNTYEYTLAQTEQKLHKMKDINVSLETRLTKSEQRNQSLEEKLNKISLDLNQKIQSLSHENTQLNTVISELNDNKKKLSEECHRLSTENQKLKSELEKCQCKELLPKANELQQELGSQKAAFLNELRNKDMQINVLTHELNLIKESAETNGIIVDSLKKDNKALLSNQEDLIKTIGELREQKQDLKVQLEGVAALEQGSFSVPDFSLCDADDLRESGISVRSIFHEGLNLQSLEHIFDISSLQRSEVQDALVQTNESYISYKTNDQATQSDVHLASVSFGTKDSASQSHIYPPSMSSDTHNVLVQTSESTISYEPKDNATQSDISLASMRNDVKNALVQTTESCLSYVTKDNATQSDIYLASMRSGMLNVLVQTNESCTSYKTRDNASQTDIYPASLSYKTLDIASQTDIYPASLRSEIRDMLVQTNESCVSYKTKDNATQSDISLFCVRSEMFNVLVQTSQSCIRHEKNNSATQTDIYPASVRSEMHNALVQTNESCTSFETKDNANQTGTYLASERTNISSTSNTRGLSQRRRHYSWITVCFSLFRTICYLLIIFISLLLGAFYNGQLEINGPIPY